MAAKWLGGFTQYEAKLPIDFSRSDLFLDPATLRGPDAQESVAAADLEGVISKAAVAAYGPDAAEMFGDGAVIKLTKAIVGNPDMLSGRTTLWLPVGSKVDIAAKGEGDEKTEQLVNAAQSK